MRNRKSDEHFVVEGHTAVERFLASSWAVADVVGTSAALARLDLTRVVAGRVHERSAARVRELVGFDFHRGCLASGLREGIADAPPAELGSRPAFRVACAIGLADPRNLGALFRNARAFGIDHVIVDRAGADPLARIAIRASMGHVFTTSWSSSPQPLESVRSLVDRSDATLWVASAQPGGALLDDLEPPPRLVVAFGNEGHGLPLAWRDAGQKVRIPLEVGADSLNVAAAAAVFFHAIRLPYSGGRS